MRAKPLLYAVVAATLLLGAASAMGADSTTSTSIYTAAPASNQPLNSNVLPVIVRVSKQGKITYLAPAYELRSQYQRLLRQSLAQMITQPAHDKSGAPIASEFIMYLTGTTTKREDGKYDFQFTYLSAKPIPFGNWIWGQFASGQLALLSPHAINYAGYYGFQRNVRNGACYYDRYYYSQCVIFTCVYYKTCRKKGKSDANGNSSNTDTDHQPKATGTQVRAASVHVYRLNRPRLVSRRIRTQGIGVARLRVQNVAQARRFPPSEPMAPQARSAQNAPIAPVFQSNNQSGMPRSAAPKPAWHGRSKW